MTTEYGTEDEYETVYQVHSAVKYGFGGNTSMWVAVTQETEDQIIGQYFPPTYSRPGKRVVINKTNVAGWEVDTTQREKLEATEFG